MSKKIEPKIRFPEFKKNGSWKEAPITSFAKLYKGKGIAKADIDPNGNQPCIRYGELYTIYGDVIDNVISRTSLPIKDLVISEGNEVLIPSSGETKEDIAKASCVLRKGIALGGDLNIIKSKQDGRFLSSYINGALKTKISKVAQGDAVVHLYISQLEKLSFALPEVKEQQKIADCFFSLDELITAQSDKVKALKNYKEGLLQQLFPQDGETVPRLRFSEFKKSGDWKKTTLTELAKVVTQKNRNFSEKRVLTNSAANGVVDQRDFFDKDIANKNNLDGYYIIDFGDFVYNPRISNLAPVGPISRNNIGKGIISPLYTVFHFTSEPTDFFEYYFKSNHWHLYLRSVANTGARHDRMAITNSILMSMPILLPKPEEQQKIAECLSSFDNLVNSEEEILKQLKNHKKGLLQQLFPAIEE